MASGGGGGARMLQQGPKRRVDGPGKLSCSDLAVARRQAGCWRRAAGACRTDSVLHVAVEDEQEQEQPQDQEQEQEQELVCWDHGWRSSDHGF